MINMGMKLEETHIRHKRTVNRLVLIIFILHNAVECIEGGLCFATFFENISSYIRF